MYIDLISHSVPAHQGTYLFNQGDLLHRASPGMQLAHDELIDVSSIAVFDGFSVPVFMTSDVWAVCIAPNNSDVVPHDVEAYEETIGGILLSAYEALQASEYARANFDVQRHDDAQVRVRLMAQLEKGHRGETVVTICDPRIA